MPCSTQYHFRSIALFGACLLFALAAGATSDNYSLGELETRLNDTASIQQALQLEEQIQDIKLRRLSSHISWLLGDSLEGRQGKEPGLTGTSQQAISQDADSQESRDQRRRLASLRRHYINYWSSQQRHQLSRDFLSIEPALRQLSQQARPESGSEQQALQRRLFAALEATRRSANTDYEIAELALNGLQMLSDEDLESFEATTPQLPLSCIDHNASVPASAHWTAPLSARADEQKLLLQQYEQALNNRALSESRLEQTRQTAAHNDQADLAELLQQLLHYESAVDLLEANALLLKSHTALLASSGDGCEAEHNKQRAPQYETLILSKLRHGKWASKLDLAAVQGGTSSNTPGKNTAPAKNKLAKPRRRPAAGARWAASLQNVKSSKAPSQTKPQLAHAAQPASQSPRAAQRVRVHYEQPAGSSISPHVVEAKPALIQASLHQAAPEASSPRSKRVRYE